MAAQKGWKNMGVLAGVTNCGRSGNGVAEEDSLEFNPKCGIHVGSNHVILRGGKGASFTT